MRIIGIDPGIRCTGFAVIEKNNKLLVLSYGTIQPPVKKKMEKRLRYLYMDVKALIKKYQPDLLAIESTFHQKNVRSALILGQAKGSIMLAAANFEVLCKEFAPRKVKSAVVGNGSANKEQVKYMIQKVLNLKKLPKQFDVSDALAVAYCGLRDAENKI